MLVLSKDLQGQQLDDFKVSEITSSLSSPLSLLIEENRSLETVKMMHEEDKKKKLKKSKNSTKSQSQDSVEQKIQNLQFELNRLTGEISRLKQRHETRQQEINYLKQRDEDRQQEIDSLKDYLRDGPK